MSKQSLGRLVQRTRQSRGLSQYALSKAGGLPVPYVQRLENGEYDTFPSQYLENICQVLGFAMGDLSAELEKPDRAVGGRSLQVIGKPQAAEEKAGDDGTAVDVTTGEETSQVDTPAAPAAALAHARRGHVDISGGDQPLLSLVPPVDPERLMADIALLSDEDQQRVAGFVQGLLKGTEQEE
jgi:transcriptional regulator with XRE-family HTH domain